MKSLLSDRRYRYLSCTYLSWLRQEELLPALFNEVLAPPEVSDEFKRLALTDPRFAGLSFPSFIKIQEPKSVPAELANNTALDLGERMALALALELHIRTVLLDEKAARRVAKKLGLRPVGVLGILLEAKERNLIKQIGPLIDALQNKADFRLGADLRAYILEQAGENS